VKQPNERSSGPGDLGEVGEGDDSSSASQTGTSFPVQVGSRGFELLASYVLQRRLEGALLGVLEAGGLNVERVR